MSEQNSVSLEFSGAQFLNGNKNQVYKLQDRFSQLLRIQQLQKSIVKQKMHNAMSPLSAISGYLELIDMTLEQDANVDQIEHYRKKIETGIAEVNEILQQLNAVYQEEVEESSLDVDLYWVVREVCKQMKVDSSQFRFQSTMKPLHVNIELYSMKLIIYELISFAMKCSTKREGIDLITDEVEGMASFKIIFTLSDHKAKDICKVLSCQNEKHEYECVKQNSMNEGLLASNKLVNQIGGFLKFKKMEGTVGRLCLFLPLS